ncbi:DUF1963 domain-containing protein [Nocardia yamanashiensis]|uniref:DUF1963 domain-containing protein n=1 Tax=Nocardia yamanashiensis TaxID=209247 RepID=UPI001E5BB1D1|nr:DUF1963 domain-containing protein [Nocardia yamanashiensis]UGT42648.1 DUF1963 domain-containing protein [Nocardia yamanashiensis]
MTKNTGPTYAIHNSSSSRATRNTRSSIGGWPYLDPGQPWPECRCGKQMALYFQIQLPDYIPHFGGDQLLMFLCPDENDAGFYPEAGQLPERYWDDAPGAGRPFWRILLQRNAVHADTPDPHFEPSRLYWKIRRDIAPGEPAAGFIVGGTPQWVQDPEHYRCACGTDLVFLCQVPEDYQFRDYAIRGKHFRSVEDGLFLGNQVYILACPARCDPAAAWPVCQN